MYREEEHLETRSTLHSLICINYPYNLHNVEILYHYLSLLSIHIENEIITKLASPKTNCCPCETTKPGGRLSKAVLP